MKPIITPTANTKFIADGCGDLPATVIQTPEGRVIETCWEMTEEEKAMVAQTGRVYVRQLGFVAPMNLETVPFAFEGNEKVQ